jgi:hypothetical protein
MMNSKCSDSVSHLLMIRVRSPLLALKLSFANVHVFEMRRAPRSAAHTSCAMASPVILIGEASGGVMRRHFHGHLFPILRGNGQALEETDSRQVVAERVVNRKQNGLRVAKLGRIEGAGQLLGSLANGRSRWACIGQPLSPARWFRCNRLLPISLRTDQSAESTVTGEGL